MKNQIIVAVAICLSLAACEKKAETAAKMGDTPDPVKIKTEIQAMETAYARNMMAKNLDSVMAYYADDIESTDGSMPTVSGKANLKETIGKELSQMPGKSDIGMQTLSVLVSDDGSLVSESGTYTMKDSTGIQKASGRFATVFRKNGNKYECVREMVMSDKKEEAKAPAPDKK